MTGADPETLAVYAARREAYEDLSGSPVERAAADRFLAALPTTADILDLGCGPGVQAAAFREAGHLVTALDACPEFVAAARARGVEARLASFDDLDDIEAYDGVYASFSLLHAPRADLPRHLAAIARALRPGGRLFLGMKLGRGEGRDALGRFYAYHSEAELRDHLARAGFLPDHVDTGRGRGLAGTDDPFILIQARRA